jgi:hypothetical protein
MIPVKLAPEPEDFDIKVRQAGLLWMKSKNLDLSKPKPKDIVLFPYWRECLLQLREAYHGICAYNCMHIQRVNGNPSVDHFAPSKFHLAAAYEWDNYRFVSATVNSRKSKFEDVLDPFFIEDGLFELNLIDGAIMPRAQVKGLLHKKVKTTIKRLGLDEDDCRKLRLEYIQDYQNKDITANYLQRKAPFIFLEMQRQGWL